ncbi:ubiquitin fusion degradation protein 1, putative, partial [Hepatocystis sp. ex Piliocolobus tephrosceles]
VSILKTLEKGVYRNEVAFPYTFSLKNVNNNYITHACVLEFSSSEGIIYVSENIKENLGITESTGVTRLLVTYANLSKCDFIKFESLNENVNDIKFMKKLLENELSLNYSTLTLGDYIHINHLHFYISEIEPDNAVSLINTDITVDICERKTVGTQNNIYFNKHDNTSYEIIEQVEGPIIHNTIFKEMKKYKYIINSNILDLLKKDKINILLSLQSNNINDFIIFISFPPYDLVSEAVHHLHFDDCNNNIIINKDVIYNSLRLHFICFQQEEYKKISDWSSDGLNNGRNGKLSCESNNKSSFEIVNGINNGRNDGSNNGSNNGINNGINNGNNNGRNDGSNNGRNDGSNNGINDGINNNTSDKTKNELLEFMLDKYFPHIMYIGIQSTTQTELLFSLSSTLDYKNYNLNCNYNSNNSTNISSTKTCDTIGNISDNKSSSNVTTTHNNNINKNCEYVKCENCLKDILASNIYMHKIHCLKNITICNICKKSFTKKNISNHIHCNICNEGLNKDEQNKHNIIWHKKIRCICHKYFYKKQFIFHQKLFCPKKIIFCSFCNIFTNSATNVPNEDYLISLFFDKFDSGSNGNGNGNDNNNNNNNDNNDNNDNNNNNNNNNKSNDKSSDNEKYELISGPKTMSVKSIDYYVKLLQNNFFFFFKYINNTEHEQYCGTKSVTCIFCKKNMYRNNYLKHLSLIHNNNDKLESFKIINELTEL